MDKYERAISPASSNQPHPDLAKNIAFFNKMVDRISWLPSAEKRKVDIEINDTVFESVYNPQDQKNETVKKIKEYRSVVFVFPKDGSKTSVVVSFHQPNRKTGSSTGFNEDLCAVLNYLGSRGLLEHKIKFNDGTPRNGLRQAASVKDDKWEQLFGSGLA